MKNKKIIFIPSSSETIEIVDSPKPSSLFIPDWYKQIISDYKKNPKFGSDGQLLNKSLKMCMPFLDSLTSGYIQKTWCDIYIEKTNSGVNFTFASSPEIMGSRNCENIKTYKNEFYPNEFFWIIQWVPRLPKGYSALFCHPLNRLDLPFYTLSGIVDSDLYHHAPNGNYPFYLKKDFEGLIPKGTPMYQIIPIKRDDWSSEEESDPNKIIKTHKKQMTVFWEFYKKNMWQRKKYE
jgi:hypothetical protein